MNNADQYELALIPHEIEQTPINQRATDGYINATAMCKAAGKQFHDYSRLSTTSDYLRALSSKTGIPVLELIESIKGGRFPQLRGTWVHPKVAIHLALWLSPEFAVQVSEWVFDWLSGQGRPGLPDHVRRYIVNQPKIYHTHFSMLNEMVLQLLAPLEQLGYRLPDKMMPDISMGKIFSNWCRKQGRDPKTFPNYDHEFVDDRRPVKARQYPNDLLTDFRIEFNKWLRDGRAERYFETRDTHALEALDKMLALPSPSVTEETKETSDE